MKPRIRLNSCYTQHKKTLNENKDKIPAGEVANIEKELNTLKSAIDSGDAEKIEAGMQSLTQASHKLAEIMYQQVQDKQPSASGTSSGSGDSAASSSEDKDDSDVIDAEFEETKN